MKTRKGYLHGGSWGRYFVYYTKAILKKYQEREFDILDTKTYNKAVIIKIEWQRDINKQNWELGIQQR